MKLRYIVYILIALGLGYFVYYRITANKKLENTGGGGGGKGAGKKDGAMLVDGVVVKTQSFENALEVTGSLEANEAVSLHGEVSGLVKGIYFKEGSHVKKGQLLVKINDLDIQAQLREAMTKQNLSASNENRAKQLLEKGAISQEEYDTSVAELQSLKAQAQLIRAQLAKTSIVAPFSGRIGLRTISEGEYLTPATAIANLLSTSPIKINFSVPEKYASQIKMNSSISFTNAGSKKIYTGKVFAIEPGINAVTRTLHIKALAQNADNELIPGSFAKIKLALSTLSDAILIPNEAVIPVENGKVVYIAKNGVAQQVAVESGARTDKNILITSGLNVGDTVLTSGSMTLKPESPVKVSLLKN
jgi:membrane fusion protein (multidrug efflux system)